MEEVKQRSKRDLSALTGAVIVLFLSGCLKTEYPNERECQPWDYDYEVLQDHARNKDTFDRFSQRDEFGRFFDPTQPSKIRWSFKNNLIFGDDEFPLEYSEDEFRWMVKDSDGVRIGTFTILSNACWGYWELLLVMESGEQGYGILRF